jgi:hypothetical protein
MFLVSLISFSRISDAVNLTLISAEVYFDTCKVLISGSSSRISPFALAKRSKISISNYSIVFLHSAISTTFLILFSSTSGYSIFTISARS